MCVWLDVSLLRSLHGNNELKDLVHFQLGDAFRSLGAFYAFLTVKCTVCMRIAIV